MNLHNGAIVYPFASRSVHGVDINDGERDPLPGSAVEPKPENRVREKSRMLPKLKMLNFDCRTGEPESTARKSNA